MFDGELYPMTSPGDSWDDAVWGDDGFDDTVYRITELALADGWTEDDRHMLPDIETIPPGPFLAVILASVDRSRLNGYDLVRVLQARDRLVSHNQAQSMADMVEISYAAPGSSGSPVARIEDQAEYASDEIRAALHLTRRSADTRLGDATDLRERLPQVWELLDSGRIDWPKARVLAEGTCHLTETEARSVVDEIADLAPHLTTGQLRALIRRLCVDTDPEKARKRYEHAVEERRLWIEPTVDGTGNLCLYDIPITTAKAIGRRVNAHMISLNKEDRTGRSHDQLRADITCDLLLGADPSLGGRGLVDIKVDLTTLAHLDERAGEIPGMGPVMADIARQVADTQPKAEWRYTVTNNGQVVHVGTTRKRPTAALSRHVQATQPVCSFPGCRTPAQDCDYDHLTPWAEGGETTTTNLGPKCRHDHQLKHHGWTHQHTNPQDIWTSPLGHTYITQGQSP
jgi:hypothetical protein